ncbi:MAG: hypothetical protein LIO94_09225 [Clostridiales bacterium]|nr:hypothetical protein [Clostridiales bacterium]
MNHLDQRIFPVLLFLAFGLLTGCALPELLKMHTAGLSSMYGFQIFERSNQDGWDLLCYVVSVRLRTLLLLWLSSFTTIGILFHLGYLWWLLASGAMLLSLFGLRNGVQGILLFFCCIFPQWFLYGIVWKKEITVWIRRVQRFRGAAETMPAALWKIRLEDIGELAGMGVTCLAGCACEAFLGTWTLRLFLQL